MPVTRALRAISVPAALALAAFALLRVTWMSGVSMS